MTAVNHAGDLGHRHGCRPEVSCKFTSTGVATNSEELVPEPSRKRRLLVLAICCSSLFIVGLDSTIVNIALPSIQRDLHAAVSGLQWTVDAYTLVVASFLILAGSTGDRVGRRRTFQMGLATFTLGSLLCSLAPGLGWLVAFRAMQAIGGSMLNPVALSIIANTFTDDRERAGRWDLGRRVRPQHGARPGARRRAGRHRGVAGDLLGQHPDRARGHRGDRARRAGVPRRARAAGGPGRPGPDHRHAGLAHLRDHRGAAPRLDLGPDPRPVRPLRAAAAGLASTSRAAPSPCSTCGSSAARRSPGRR